MSTAAASLPPGRGRRALEKPYNTSSRSVVTAAKPNISPRFSVGEARTHQSCNSERKDYEYFPMKMPYEFIGREVTRHERTRRAVTWWKNGRKTQPYVVLPRSLRAFVNSWLPSIRRVAAKSQVLHKYRQDSTRVLFPTSARNPWNNSTPHQVS